MGRRAGGWTDSRHREVGGLSAFLDAVGDLLLAGTYAAAWVTPNVVGGERGVAALVGVMVLEFVVVHSSMVLGLAMIGYQQSRKGLRPILGLLAGYCVFAVGISAGFKNPWLFAGFVALHLNRLVPLLLGRSVEVTPSREAWKVRWGLGALLYVGSVFVSIVPFLPRLGAPSALHGVGSGAWVDDPHRALAAGVVYFGGQAALLIWVGLRGRWPRGQSGPPTA